MSSENAAQSHVRWSDIVRRASRATKRTPPEQKKISARPDKIIDADTLEIEVFHSNLGTRGYNYQFVATPVVAPHDDHEWERVTMWVKSGEVEKTVRFQADAHDPTVGRANVELPGGIDDYRVEDYQK